MLIRSLTSSVGDGATQGQEGIRSCILARTASTPAISWSISPAVKLFKGISARQLRLWYPELRKRTRSDRLWAPSYYVGTAGHGSSDTIRRYIEVQESHHAN
jgi:hypothetical protein